MKKIVYRVNLDGKFGYYRSVVRKPKASVAKEAKQVYPYAKIEVQHEPNMTAEQAHAANLASMAVLTK